MKRLVARKIGSFMEYPLIQQRTRFWTYSTPRFPISDRTSMTKRIRSQFSQSRLAHRAICHSMIFALRNLEQKRQYGIPSVPEIQKVNIGWFYHHFEFCNPAHRFPYPPAISSFKDGCSRSCEKGPSLLDLDVIWIRIREDRIKHGMEKFASLMPLRRSMALLWAIEAHWPIEAQPLR
jgi:hypothetical protein